MSCLYKHYSAYFLYVNDLFYYFLFVTFGEFSMDTQGRRIKKAPYGKRLFCQKKLADMVGNCNDPPSGL